MIWGRATLRTASHSLRRAARPEAFPLACSAHECRRSGLPAAEPQQQPWRLAERLLRRPVAASMGNKKKAGGGKKQRQQQMPQQLQQLLPGQEAVVQDGDLAIQPDDATAEKIRFIFRWAAAQPSGAGQDTSGGVQASRPTNIRTNIPDTHPEFMGVDQFNRVLELLLRYEMYGQEQWAAWCRMFDVDDDASLPPGTTERRGLTAQQFFASQLYSDSQRWEDSSLPPEQRAELQEAGNSSALSSIDQIYAIIKPDPSLVEKVRALFRWATESETDEFLSREQFNRVNRAEAFFSPEFDKDSDAGALNQEDWELMAQDLGFDPKRGLHYVLFRQMVIVEGIPLDELLQVIEQVGDVGLGIAKRAEDADKAAAELMAMEDNAAAAAARAQKKKEKRQRQKESKDKQQRQEEEEAAEAAVAAAAREVLLQQASVPEPEPEPEAVVGYVPPHLRAGTTVTPALPPAAVAPQSRAVRALNQLARDTAQRWGAQDVSQGIRPILTVLSEPPDSLTFLRDYVGLSVPCVVCGGCSGREWATAREWTLEYLASVMGDATISVDVTPDGKAGGVMQVVPWGAGYVQANSGGGGGEKWFVRPEQRRMTMTEFMWLLVSGGGGGTAAAAQRADAQGCRQIPQLSTPRQLEQHEDIRDAFEPLAADLPADLPWASGAFGRGSRGKRRHWQLCVVSTQAIPTIV